jgi:hypothetical protein
MVNGQWSTVNVGRMFGFRNAFTVGCLTLRQVWFATRSLNGQWAMLGQWSMVNSQWAMLGQWSMINGQCWVKVGLPECACHRLPHLAPGVVRRQIGQWSTVNVGSMVNGQ